MLDIPCKLKERNEETTKSSGIDAAKLSISVNQSKNPMRAVVKKMTFKK